MLGVCHPRPHHLRAEVLGGVGEVGDECRGHEAVEGEGLELVAQPLHLLLPAPLLPSQLAQQRLRRLELVHRLLEGEFERLRLARAACEVALESGHAGVEGTKLLLALCEAIAGDAETVLKGVQLLLHGCDALEDHGVLDVGLDPGGERGGGHGDAEDDGVLEGVGFLLQQLHHVAAVGGVHLPRIEVDDFLLDRALPEERPHVAPRGVRLPHELENPLEHIADGVGGHLETADLVDVVALDLPHGLAGRLQHRLHLPELVLDPRLALREHALLLGQLDLQRLHLGLGSPRLRHRRRDLRQSLLRLRLLLLQEHALGRRLAREPVHGRSSLLQLVEAAL
mmetsp:Transcript_17017/g.54252  ORF Transcript_17017/g.54252 Transcript_17017/m.54252 type:complete len:339 (-) Transcript_17017:8850-9866(-)